MIHIVLSIKRYKTIYIKNPTSFFNKSISDNLVNYSKFQIEVDDNIFEHLPNVAIFTKYRQN
ncbi:hypothetical protein [Borreliella garinii]|uniref:hypothetical protein n=1 Tax=Borreliella garinii TaxID=29519 RepID=UPI0004089C6B|nr:hypothetical protein [Borreliella garinii]